MTTEIQLHHVGEVVLAGLLRELANRRDLDAACKCHENCRLAEVLKRAEVGLPVAFDANVKLGCTVINGETLIFDGAHGVDVLCHGPNSRGLAVEAKLGLDRMASNEFQKRFLAPVSLTTHTRRRIKGSMVAILNYRALQGGEALPLRTDAASAVELVPAWFLVIRRAVWEQWTHNGQLPPLAPNAHVAIFEDIVHKHGNAQLFDALVRRLVGSDFYQSWDI